MKKTKRFSVSATMKLVVSIDVQAKSLEEALEKGRLMDVQDFVTIDGDYIDGNLEIDAVYEQS